ncbi:MAG TPA: class II aldolase/adducin family protein [Candidatus Lustribacter sp.]|jgi:ribulose-5-phosphate 4-epimerase/fuculose-1-phosphate aldolase|nr:class II aldolase/adducin family protein [Candidatus Lustribacter sp.]
MSTTADPLRTLIDDLVDANHILAHEGVVDAFGHISARHPANPQRFFLSCSRSPELVEAADIMEFGLDGKTPGPDARSPYLERYIHGAIYEARPDVQAVIHSHAEDILPFTISKTLVLRPVISTAGGLGSEAPVWDIRDAFGATDLLVTSVPQGRDLAGRLGAGSVVLMRGHGFAAGGTSIYDVVSLAVNLPKNARVLMNALRFGDVVGLSDEELALRDARPQYYPPGTVPRAWEYWKARAAAGR